MIDANLILEPLAGGAVTVTGVSTNVIDMGSLRDPGAGIMEPLEIHVKVVAAFTAAGAATLQIGFEVSALGISFLPIMFSPVYAKADLVANAGLFRYRWPVNQLNNVGLARYFRLSYTVATGPMTAGSLAAWITAGGDRDQRIEYPSNYTA